LREEFEMLQTSKTADGESTGDPPLAIFRDLLDGYQPSKRRKGEALYAYSNLVVLESSPAPDPDSHQRQS
jgi:hypothetical protein